MNTAARMESHGLAGQIHISEDTAKALMAKGKSHWVTPRNDTIDVKGKGLLKTFWVVNRKDREVSRAESSAGYTDDESVDHGIVDQADKKAPTVGLSFEI
jgi:ammonium transporter, Amt family